MSLRLDSHEIELLAALNDCMARYMVVGGHAAIFHGDLRSAKNIDLWFEPNDQNARRVARALRNLTVGANLQPDQIERLAEPGQQMHIDGLGTRLLTSVTGLEFEKAMARSFRASEQGVPFHVLGLADLIECERRLAREVDSADIDYPQANC